MFGRTKAIFAVNKAISEIGIDTQTIDPGVRAMFQTLVVEKHCTPQEIATYLCFGKVVRGEFVPDGYSAIIESWLLNKKVNEEFFNFLDMHDDPDTVLSDWLQQQLA